MHNDPPSPILHKLWHKSPQLGVVDTVVVVVVVVDGSVGVDDFLVVVSVTVEELNAVHLVASEVFSAVDSE